MFAECIADISLNKYYDLIYNTAHRSTQIQKHITKTISRRFVHVKYDLKNKEVKKQKTVGNEFLSFKLVEEVEKKLCYFFAELGFEVVFLEGIDAFTFS